MGFAFQAAVACCDIGTLFNPVILSGTLSFGKANDKVESKDPMFVDTTPGNARRSHRAIIGWVDQPLRVLCARACPERSRRAGNHTDRTMGFASHAACAPNERA